MGTEPRLNCLTPENVAAADRLNLRWISSDCGTRSFSLIDQAGTPVDWFALDASAATPQASATSATPQDTAFRPSATVEQVAAHARVGGRWESKAHSNNVRLAAANGKALFGFSPAPTKSPPPEGAGIIHVKADGTIGGKYGIRPLAEDGSPVSWSTLGETSSAPATVTVATPPSRPVAAGDRVLLKKWYNTVNGLGFQSQNTHLDGKVVVVTGVCLDGDVVFATKTVRQVRWAKGCFEATTLPLSEDVAPVLNPVPFRDFPSADQIEAHERNGGVWEVGALQIFRHLWREGNLLKGWNIHSTTDARGPGWLVNRSHQGRHRPLMPDGTPVTWESLESAATPPASATSKATSVTATSSTTTTSTTHITQETTMPTMPNTTPTTAPAANRNRAAIDEALRRAPVEWSLDEAHEMIVKLAVGTVKVRAHKPIIKAWVEEQLQTEYGKALLGVVVGNVAPMVAPYLGRGEALVQRVADELLAVSYKKGMVRAARDLKKVGGPLLKMGMKLFSTLFDRVEDAERMRAAGALEAGRAGGDGVFAEAVLGDKVTASA